MPTSKAVGVKKYGPMKKKVGQKGRAAEVEMREFGMGKLHSGSKTGPKVKNRKQAIAIALNEERKAQGRPTRKSAGKDANRRKRNIGRS